MNELVNIPPEEYYNYLMECYQKEDEFLKEIFEDSEADYWINQNNFDF